MPTNVFKELKDKYAGVSTEIDLTQFEQQLLEQYDNTYNKIYKQLTDYYTSIDYPAFSKQSALLKQIGEILDNFKKTSGDYFKKAIETVAVATTKGAIKDVGTYAETTKKLDWHYEFAKSYAETVFNDNFKHIAGQTDKIEDTIKKDLRDIATRTFQRASVEGLSRKEAYKLIKDEVLSKHPDFKFIDKAGRSWDSRKYFEMLTRTVLANTRRESYVQTLINEGQDLAKISVHNAKDACKNWEGKIVSLTGATKGYPTLQEAIASGEVFHPRCKHRLVAYHPDIEEVFNLNDEEVEKQLNELKQKANNKQKVAIDAEVIDLDNTDQWELVGGQLGSNKGGLYLDKLTGKKYYVKMPRSDVHALNEYIANQLYKKLGANVPNLQVKKLSTGKLGVFSEWEEGLKKIDVDRFLKNAKLKKEAYKYYAIDAWLANWDTVGLEYDNIVLTKDGKIFRVDAGGSLLFRAQGGAKGELFGKNVIELETFKDSFINPQSAEFFRDVTDKNIKTGVNMLSKLSNKDIKQIIVDSGLYSVDYATANNLYHTLIDRKKFLIDKYKTASKKTSVTNSISARVSDFEADELEEFNRRWNKTGSFVYLDRYFTGGLERKYTLYVEKYLENDDENTKRFVKSAMTWTSNFYRYVDAWKFDYSRKWDRFDNDALVTKAINKGVKRLAQIDDFDADKYLETTYGDVYKNDPYLRTYRGMNGAHDFIPLMRSLKKDKKVFTPHSLMSTSPEKPWENREILIEFRLKKEPKKFAYVKKISAFENENELLLQSGLNYKVVEIRDLTKEGGKYRLNYNNRVREGYQYLVVLEEI